MVIGRWCDTSDRSAVVPGLSCLADGRSGARGCPTVECGRYGGVKACTVVLIALNRSCGYASVPTASAVRPPAGLAQEL
jgi:hypothetical protein